MERMRDLVVAIAVVGFIVSTAGHYVGWWP